MDNTLNPRSPHEAGDEELAMFCKALGHPVRVRLLRLLAEKGMCVTGSLAEEFDLAQSTVSEHLRILKQAGLIEGVVEGQRCCYCLNLANLKVLKESLIRI